MAIETLTFQREMGQKRVADRGISVAERKILVAGPMCLKIEEIKRFPEASGNWIYNLPGGYYTKLVKNWSNSNNPEIRKMPDMQHEQYGGRSMRELHGDVNSVIVKKNISPEEIKELMLYHPFIDTGTEQGLKSFRKLVWLTVPVIAYLGEIMNYPLQGIIA